MQAEIVLGYLAFLSVTSAVPIKMADHVVDMSYSFVDKTMPYFPGGLVFSIKSRFAGVLPAGNNKMFVSKYAFETAEHGGTHYDAPTHFCNSPGCWYPEEIPISRFFGEVCVVDVSESAAKTASYGVSVRDLINHERKYGRIPDGSYVVMYSGWGKFISNKTAYMGHPTDTTKMAWPAFSAAATKWLLDNRDIKGIGVDSLSLDVPNLQLKMTHVLALGRNKIGLENLANVDKIPARGASIIAFPMKIKGGSGGPARVVAMWNNGSASINMCYIVLLSALAMIKATL